MRMKVLFCIGMLVVAGAAQAAPITTLSSDVVHELSADGTSTTDKTVVIRINEQTAVTGAGQAQLQFSESLQQLDIIEAYTTTKSGQRVDVALDRIVTQQLPASAGAPTFSDYKVKNVVFPQVEVGATLTLHYRMKQLKPFLQGVFSGGESLSRVAEYQNATVTLRAPEKIQIYTFARGVQGGAVKSGRPGMNEWRWTSGPTSAETPEPGSVAAASISPGVMFSTLKDYPELADAYMIGAAPAANVTPAVQQLADEITKGITDRRAQADAIYHWVSSEIRYVQIAMGTGGYVPHNVSEILATRYGDCKDKTTLLTSLLGAKGIRALPVLINASDRYSWQEVPLLVAFNHAIAYLPDFDLYLDSTIALAPFNALPDALRGRAALVTGDSRTKASVRQTPDVNPTMDRTVKRTKATVTPDGSVSGTTWVDVYGAQDALLRTTFSLLPAQAIPQLGKAVLAETGQSGEAKFALGDLHNFSNPNMYTVEFTTPGRINLPGPGALTGNFGAQSSAARSFVTSMLQLERKLDFPCPAGGAEDLVELALPQGMKITSLPGAANIESPFGRFTASHEVKDGKLLMTQKLALQRPRTVCTAADHVELRKFATAIDRELRKQILYE